MNEGRFISFSMTKQLTGKKSTVPRQAARYLPNCHPGLDPGSSSTL